VSRDDTRQSLFCRMPTVGSRQRLMAVSFGTDADDPLPSALFAECLTLGKLVFAEWGPVPSVQHLVKRLFAESLTLPSAALGKAFFAECPTKGTRQRVQRSAKPRIPVVMEIDVHVYTGVYFVDRAPTFCRHLSVSCSQYLTSCTNIMHETKSKIFFCV
jgi:hypothetical protein